MAGDFVCICRLRKIPLAAPGIATNFCFAELTGR